MKTVEQRLEKIEAMLLRITENMNIKVNSISDKWLTEPQVMEILNLTKRAMKDIRKNCDIRTSSATGRNFKYYKADVENYLYDHSHISKRRSAK